MRLRLIEHIRRMCRRRKVILWFSNQNEYYQIQGTQPRENIVLFHSLFSLLKKTGPLYCSFTKRGPVGYLLRRLSPKRPFAAPIVEPARRIISGAIRITEPVINVTAAESPSVKNVAIAVHSASSVLGILFFTPFQV